MPAVTADDQSKAAAAVGSRYRRFRPRLALGYQQISNRSSRNSPRWTRMRPSKFSTPRSGPRRPTDRASVHSGCRHRPRTDGSLRSDAPGAPRPAGPGLAIREDDEGIILDAPGRAAVRLDDPEAAKESLRRSFAFARDAQCASLDAGVHRDDGAARGRPAVHDGAELATRLTAQGTGGDPAVLQVIEPGARDETTGLLLQDIWRYARHFWSIPYQSTPGRNLFYLVRDAALPERPLIGIAALGNPVLGLAKRDDHFGWSREWPRATPAGSRRPQAPRARRPSRSVLRDGFEATYSDDLGVRRPAATARRPWRRSRRSSGLAPRPARQTRRSG